MAAPKGKAKQGGRSFGPPNTQPDVAMRSETTSYVPYFQALSALRERLGATAEELAAWIFMGPGDGGLAAYRNANEFDTPPRFYFDEWMGENYLAAMAGCWFSAEDIERFEPGDRFITGAALVARWMEPLGEGVGDFVRTKIEESRLIDLHPTYGGTQATTADEAFPPLEQGLFVLAHVQAVEADDFGWTESPPLVPPVGSAKWRAQSAKAAADARHARPGGSRDKQAQMREAWASGKYTSRDRCAEEECAALDMSYSAARKALRNTADP